MKARNVNDVKSDERRIVTSCGVAAIMPSKKEEDAVNRYILKIRNAHGGELLDVVVNPEFAPLPVHSDKEYGPYLGDQKTTEFMWINLFHYLYWKRHAKEIEQMVQQFIAQYPAAQEVIADVYRWARETYINNALVNNGKKPIYNVAPPKFDPYANIAINSEGFCAYTSSVMGNMISVMAQNGAPIEYVADTMNQLANEITGVLQYYSDNIQQEITMKQQEQTGQIPQQSVSQQQYYGVDPQTAAMIEYNARQQMLQQYAANQANALQQQAMMMQQQGYSVDQINQFVSTRMQQINNQVVAFTSPQQESVQENEYVPVMSNPSTPKDANLDISAAVQTEKDFVTDFGDLTKVNFYPIDEPDMGHPNPVHPIQMQYPYDNINATYGAMGNNPFATRSDFSGNF